MNEVKVINQATKVHGKKLIDWGLSVETAGLVESIEEFLKKVPIVDRTRENAAQQFFVGYFKKFKPVFKMSELEVKTIMDEGFESMQTRKRKRIRAGIVTLKTFETEFNKGGEIYGWLLDNYILKRISKDKAQFKGFKNQQREKLMIAYPDNFVRALTILELSIDPDVKIKPKYFYQDEGLKEWRSL